MLQARWVAGRKVCRVQLERNSVMGKSHLVLDRGFARSRDSPCVGLFGQSQIMFLALRSALLVPLHDMHLVNFPLLHGRCLGTCHPRRHHHCAYLVGCIMPLVMHV